MARYTLFTDNNVFESGAVNEACDNIFNHVQDSHPDFIDKIFIGGSVGLILQGEPPTTVKDIDVIVTDRSLFTKLSGELGGVIGGSVTKEWMRFWIDIPEVKFEFWSVDKIANIVDYNGIALEKKSDILIYRN